MIIKLEVQSKYRRPFDSPFYFRTMSDCKEFMYVFKDHWCNVPWDKPVEIDIYDVRLSANAVRTMQESPKERAERNLSWGFSLVKDFKELDKLSTSQASFVRQFVDRIEKENRE